MNSFRTLKKSLSRKFSEKIDNFLQQMKLYSQQQNVVQIKHAKKKEEKEQDVEKLIEQFLEPVKPEELNTLELLLSPFYEDRKEEIRKYKEQILNQNLIQKERIQKEFDKNYKKLADGTYGNIEWALKHNVEQIKYLREFFQEKLEFKGVDPQILENLLLTYNLQPEEILYDSLIPYKYPGSKKGMRPEDDPESFQKFFMYNISDSYYRFLKNSEDLINSLQKIEKDEEIENQQNDNYLEILTTPNKYEEIKKDYFEKYDTINQISQKKYFPKQNKMILEKEEDYIDEKDHVENSINLEEPFPDHLKSRLPYFPARPTGDQKQFYEYLALWQVLSCSLNFSHRMANLPEILNYLQKKQEKNIQEFIDKGYPTIMAYYNLLPEEVRKSAAVIQCVCILERFGYHMTLKQKQRLVNFAASFSRPISEKSNIVGSALVRSNRKYYPTVRDYINFSMIEDDGTAINSPKRLALENLKPEDEYIAPPYKDDPECIDDPTEVNPIDFYDNEDGFWNEFIEKKKKKYAKVTIYIDRPFFKH